MDNNLEILCSLAIKAALKGGREIMAVYNLEDRGVEIKDDNTPVTLADLRSNKAIEYILGSSNIPIVSEESKHVAYEERKTWKRLWMVDPLDGTKEFIKRNGQFTVNIALIENNYPILGVSFLPVHGWLYCGFNGMSLKYELKDWMNYDDNEFLNHASSINLPSIENSTPLVAASISHDSLGNEQFINILKKIIPNLKVERIGSSLKLCLIAEGYANIYPRLGTTMEWDTAAGDAILHNAAGIVVKLDDRTLFEYNKPDFKNPDFIALSKGFEEILHLEF